MTKPDVSLLALETSGRSGSVAILRAFGERVQCESELLDANAGSAKTLAPAIHRLLERLSMLPSDLTAIAAITGPGSFTGLRVGVTMAKAMAFALNLPTIEVDSLDAIAYQTDASHPLLHVVIDAYRGQVFYAGYAADSLCGEQSSRYVKRTDTQILDIEDFLELIDLQQDDSGRALVCGPGCSRIRKYLGEPENQDREIATRLSGKIIWRDGPDAYPNAESVAILSYSKLLGRQSMNAFQLTPRYFRASAAEELVEKKKRES